MNSRWSRPAVLAVLAIAGLVLVDLARGPIALGQDRERSRPESGAGVRVKPPEERPGRERWILGATVETLDTGVRVRNVAPRSAAERAGLERDDVIVTVNGFQVGRVGGRDFPLDSELQLRADSSGGVRLLVQDRRSSQLTNLDVRLDRDQPTPPPAPREGVVGGEVTYRERLALPRGAELRMKIIRRKPLGAEVIAERTYKLQGQPPFAFELRYARAVGDDRQTYEIEAEIIADGRRWFSEDGTYRFKPADSPTRLSVSMKRR